MALRPAAYQGSDPYIFISYCHKDSEAIYPIITALQQQGLRVWYDEGIEVGSHWDQVISQHLLDCSCALCSRACALRIVEGALPSFTSWLIIA